MPPGLGIVSTVPPTRSTITGSVLAAMGAGPPPNPPNVQDVAAGVDGDGDGDGAVLAVALGEGTGVVRLKLNVPLRPFVSLNVPERTLPSGETTPVECEV
jgi:hypothetical protein